MECVVRKQRNNKITHSTQVRQRNEIRHYEEMDKDISTFKHSANFAQKLNQFKSQTVEISSFHYAEKWRWFIVLHSQQPAKLNLHYLRNGVPTNAIDLWFSVRPT